MLVTFDSRIKGNVELSSPSDGVTYGLTHPIAGDNGAAVLDAINYVIGLFQQERGIFDASFFCLSPIQG